MSEARHLYGKRDAMGYQMPYEGTASTTVWNIKAPLSCGMSDVPYGNNYVAINQLAFGTNEDAFNHASGGAGGACGACFELTPVKDGKARPNQKATFMVVENCPANPSRSDGHTLCSACETGDKNDLGETWHFDILKDHMSSSAVEKFFDQADHDEQQWDQVQFKKLTACDGVEQPEFKGNNCPDGKTCHNSKTDRVCDGLDWMRKK
ncbi:MAG: hypothetical protein M1833_007311 [Piccolia ochrophora]|nr:MAG: hypothetical protein M1833_007311 [Piccolia ochrophora]